MKLTLLLGLAAAAASLQFQSDQQQVLGPAPAPAPKKPNFVFIITDDQDLQLNSIEYMPLVQKHVKEQGNFFSNHFVTTALCCPSRVSLWTGRQAHNTNVTDVSPPYGGYPKFVERGFNNAFLPIWLQSAGYNTYYTGKLFNAHTIHNYHSPYVNGFNGSDFLLDPFTYSYLNSTYQRNRDEPVSYEGQHTIDVITQKALGFLDDGLNESGDRPFFLTVAPVAPHANVDVHALGDESPTVLTEPVPLDRHKHLFEGVRVPRTESFNPNESSGVNWIQDLPKQDTATVEYNDHFYRQRLRALQGVDELVDSLVTKLEASGQLENTYIIYTSDNGYHIGQHRLPPGKACGFEEDIRVPLFIRGPGVPKNEVQNAVTTHIDLAPTIFDLAQISLREDFDGTPIPLLGAEHADYARHEHVTVEYWGKSYLEGERGALSNPDGLPFFTNNTYKSVRIIGEGYNLYYSVWCTNEHELYDLTTDPYQLHNLYPTTSKNGNNAKIFGHSLPKVLSRLDSLLLVLKSCKGTTCIKPWDVLHPGGHVKNLHDALNSLYDAFYADQARVSFDHCEHGYIPEVEGPQVAVPFSRYGLNWDVWT